MNHTLPSRAEIAALIAERIHALLPALTHHYATSGHIAHFIVDDLLPASLASSIASVFPPASAMHFKSTLRERKYISSQMNQYHPLLEDTLFAFHDTKIVSLMEQITGHTPLHADPMLYAGGISSMEQGCFLNPHLDNSHNKDRTLWRSLNLLYYISPDWQENFGGHLELWPGGMQKPQTVVESRFNRLVVMQTHHHSLHSVSPVVGNAARHCISNYYFSEHPMRADQPFHITAFRGRPEQPLRDLCLRADTALRMMLRRVKAGGFFRTGHWYEQKTNSPTNENTDKLITRNQR